jgi:hypothetical protein
MTRPIESIEADRAAVRQAHQEAVETHRLARELANGLRARAVAGDASVSAQDLAQAEDAANFAELPIAAKFEAIKPLDAELKKAETELFADEASATEAALRYDHERAVANAQAAADYLVTTWKAHATYVQQVSGAVGRGIAADVSPRVRRGATSAGAVFIDGVAMRHIPVLDPAERLHRKVLEQLMSGQPKAQS